MGLVLAYPLVMHNYLSNQENQIAVKESLTLRASMTLHSPLQQCCTLEYCYSWS
jgi:hypothetical protein